MRNPQGRPIRRQEIKRYSRPIFVESGYINQRLKDKKDDKREQVYAVGFTTELLTGTVEEGEGS